jgi:hypothetical protein
MNCDVIVYDNSGPPGAFGRLHNASKPTGGTEVHAVQLCEGLVGAGLGVVGVSALPVGEISNAHAAYVQSVKDPSCRALVTVGLTPVPPIPTDRHVVLWTHDPPHNVPHLEQRMLRWSEFVCVSHWQANRFPRGWKTRVIPAMIDDWIYDLPRVEKDPMRFVCVSAWWKGSLETLRAWEEIAPRGARLEMGSPYSHPPNAREIVERVRGCSWIDLANPRAVVEAMRSAAGVFRVIRAPETFGATDAIAQVLGCRVHALTLGDPGALPEVLAPSPGWVTSDASKFAHEFRASVLAPPRAGYMIEGRNYRAARVIPMWKEALDL